MDPEPAEQRAIRLRRRQTFDAVPDLYEATRRGYPGELLDTMVRTAALEPGSAVLEIGCGTGQLTRQLIPLGFDLTAIDLSPAMVTKARSVLGDDGVRLVASPFEDFDAPPSTFSLVVSATAFHWLDPDVAFAKSARLLRPGGWLAVLETGEVYDDPFGAALRSHWMGLDPTPPGARRPTPTVGDAAAASGWFGRPHTSRYEQRLELPPELVAGVERTRATVLDYPPPVRVMYDRGLDALLEGVDRIALTQRSVLTMVERRS